MKKKEQKRKKERNIYEKMESNDSSIKGKTEMM